MVKRRLILLAALALLVPALALALVVQGGRAYASNLAQATTTATSPVLGTATLAVTPIVTTTLVAITPTTTRPAPTPAATVAPLPGSDMPVRTITVSGMGEASAAPSEAYVQVGVQTDAETAGEALSQNNQAMQSVMDALVDAGVAEADIQTQFLSLHPRYSDSAPLTDTNRIEGYTAVNSVEARVRSLDSLGDVLDEAVAAGANNIGGIRFAVSDTTELRSEARAAAMQAARAQAQELAQLAGAALGPVISISEGSSGGPIMSADRAVEASVPIAPGSQSIQVHLQVTWLLQ